MKPLKIVHLTDLHFSFFNWNPMQFFSKEWLGNLNLSLFRKKAFSINHLWKSLQVFEQLSPDAICITGDFATTSLAKEFDQAARWVNNLKEKFQVFYLPGNHDYYTKKASKKKLFYQFFENQEKLLYSLLKDRIEFQRIKDNWWWVGLDCAVPTSLFSSHGVFFPETGNILKQMIDNLPKNDFIILGNHFPLFSTGRPRHDLKNDEKLQAILKDANPVKLYLHGHDHSGYIINRQNEGYPLSINPGTCSLMGKAAFNFLELTEKNCHVHTYYFENEQWQPRSSKNYFLRCENLK